MTSHDYWKQREEEWAKEYVKQEKEYAAHIHDVYQYMMEQCQKDIDAFYARYADREEITIAEAKRRVKKIDMEAYERKAKKYVEQAAADREKYGNTVKDAEYFSEQANEEMALYNLTMKVNRLEMLKAELGLETLPGFDDLNQYFGEKLTDRSLEEMQHFAGILGDTVRNPGKKASSIVNASFHNATFSDRLWAHQSALHDELNRQLTRGLIGGVSSARLARSVQKTFDASYNNAYRLMRTELCRVQVGAQMESYKANDVEMYEYIGGQAGACDICSSLDGKPFYVSDMMPGTNAPPMHPYCKCSTAPYVDRKSYNDWLDSGAAADGITYKDFREAA